jgi:uncharacterized protein YjbJ (UPF0337 family)
LFFWYCSCSVVAGGDILVGAGSAGWQVDLARDPNADAGCARRAISIHEGVNTGNSFSEKFSKEKRRDQMKTSTKDQIEGKFHELKGDAKQKAGQVTNNPNLETKGQTEKVAGKVQKKVGQIEKVLEK